MAAGWHCSVLILSIDNLPIITIIIFIWQICLLGTQTDNSIRFAMEGIHSLMNSKYAIDLSEAGGRLKGQQIFLVAKYRQKDCLDDDF